MDALIRPSAPAPDRASAPAARGGFQAPALPVQCAAGSLRWLTGSLCASLGASMLIAPHAFSAPAYAPIQPYLSWFGGAALAAAVALLGEAGFSKSRGSAVGGHLLTAAILLVLAVGFARSGDWLMLTNYMVIGVAVALAPRLTAAITAGAGQCERPEPPRPEPAEPTQILAPQAQELEAHPTRPDLLVIAAGLSHVLGGLLLVWQPGPAAGSWPIWAVVLLAGALLFSGLGLLTAELRPPPVRWARAGALVVAGALSFGMLSVTPAALWASTGPYYGGLGVVLLAFPWLEPHLSQQEQTSLRRRLALVLVLAATLPLILAAAMASERAEQTAEREALILQQVLATTLSQDVATYVGFNGAAVSAVALQPGLTSMSPDDQRSLLRVMSRTYLDISDLFTFDAAGNGVARSDDGPRIDLSGTVIYEDTLRTSRSSLAVLAWPLFSRPVFVLGAPIRETDGSLAGLVIGVVESERLATLLSAASGGASEIVYLVDGNGRVIAHPNDALVASFHDSSRTPPVAALLSHGAASGSLTYQDGAERRVAGWSRVPGLGWGVVVERTEAAVLASVRAGREVIFEMLLVVIGAAAVAGAISATWLAAPLVGLTSAVDRLAHNDTSAPLPRSRISEVAQLASHFGELRDRLARRTQEREQAEADLKHQATHDGLTGLPNRVYLTSSLRAEVGAARQTGLPLAFLLMDLNRFKEVNDTLGHQAGDLLLCQVGMRLRNALRSGDLVARLGGDEFALILPNTDTATAIEICRRLLDILEQPFTLAGHQADIGGSIGIASWPLHGEDAESLMRAADVAMYVAKRSRAGCTVYAPEYDEPDPDRLTLLSELREAIESHALLLHYQPTIDMETGAVVCVEALVRWRHPSRGLTPPSEFVPLMEQLGLGDRLGAWVLNRALRDVQAWNQRGLDVTVAVNLSATMLHDPGLIDTIRTALEESGVRATQLILEITESDIVVDPQRAAQALAALRDMRIRIAIDDFGTGYSSLAYIKMLSAHLIKVDRSFVAGMTTDLRDLAIVRSVIDLGRNLGLELVAEGVEDLHTWNTLTKLGCDRAQGYLISHPLPPAELIAWLENWNRQPLLPANPSSSSRGQVLPLPLHRRPRPDPETCGASGGAPPVESTESQVRLMTPGRRSER